MPDISRRKNKYNTKRNDRYVDRSLPQKSSQDKYSYSTNKAANDIKNDVNRKTYSTSESRNSQNNNVANYRRGAQRKPYNKRRLDEDAKDIQWRAISGQNGTGVLHEREDGNKHPLDKAFDVGGKFISNFMDSVADYSPIGGAYTIATGKTLTGDAYKNNPYETQRQQGISATLGRMAGMMTDYALMRSAFNPVLEKTAGAVLNGTKLGQAIQGSSVLGKIGQTVGTDALNKMTTGLVKETISDATLGFGQNALINYGSGLRGSDFWKQQAIDTALDFGVGGAMEGIGIGKQIKNANTALKQMSAESATDFLKGVKTKDEYIDALINRANEQMDIGYKEGIAPQLKKTASDKSNEFLEEAAKVDKMTPKQFNRYKLGRDLDENVKYYDATRGRTVKNAYEGDIETVKNTPVEERERFGNRPKSIGNEATAQTTTEPTKEVVTEYINAKRPTKRDFRNRNKNFSTNGNAGATETPPASVAEQPRATAEEANVSTGIPESYEYTFSPNKSNASPLSNSEKERQILEDFEELSVTEEPTPSRLAISSEGDYSEKEAEAVLKKNGLLGEEQKPSTNKANVSETNKSSKGKSSKKKSESTKEKPVKAEPEKPKEEVVKTEPVKEAEQPVKTEASNTGDSEFADKMARQKAISIVREDIEKRYGKVTSKEEQDLLVEYTVNKQFDKFDELAKKVGKRKAVTEKSKKTTPTTPHERQYSKVSVGDTSSADKNNIKNLYPNATDEEVEEFIKLRESGDREGIKRLTDAFNERDLKNNLKDLYPSASDEEITSLYQYAKNNDEDNFDKLSNEIRERSSKETKKVAEERRSSGTEAQRNADERTERQILIDEYEAKARELRAEKKIEAAEEQELKAKELKDMDEADYRVKKYNLQTTIDNSTTKALAIAENKQDYIDYLNYRDSPEISDARRQRIKAEKRKIEPISEEQFKQYQTGKYNPPEVAEQVGQTKEKKFVEGYEADRTISDLSKKAEATRKKRTNIKGRRKRGISEQEAEYNRLFDEATRARTTASREKKLKAANDVKNKTRAEWEEYKAKNLQKKEVKRGVKDLSDYTAKEKGLDKNWKLKEVSDCTSYKGGNLRKSLGNAMAVIREIVGDYTQHGLLKPFKDSFELKSNPPFSVSLIADITGFKKSMGETAAKARVATVLKKAGISDPSKLDTKTVSSLFNVDTHTLNKALKKRRKRKIMVEPDSCSPFTLSRITGLPEKTIRDHVNASKDMSINEYGNVVIDFKKYNSEVKGKSLAEQFEDGYLDNLKTAKNEMKPEEVNKIRQRVREDFEEIKAIVEEYQEKNAELPLSKLAEEIGMPEYEVSDYVKFGEGLRFDESKNVRLDLGKGDGYDEELLKGYIPEEYLETSITDDAEALMREMNADRYGGAPEAEKPAPPKEKAKVATEEKPANGVLETRAEQEGKVIGVPPEKTTKQNQTLPTEAELRAHLEKGEYPLNFYTNKELKAILRKNKIPYESGMQRPALEDIFRKRGIGYANVEPSGESRRITEAQRKLFDEVSQTRVASAETVTPQKAELPQGKPVTSEPQVQPQKGGLETKAEKKGKAKQGDIELQEVLDGKRDWKTMGDNGMRKLAAHNDIKIPRGYKKADVQRELEKFFKGETKKNPSIPEYFDEIISGANSKKGIGWEYLEGKGLKLSEISKATGLGDEEITKLAKDYASTKPSLKFEIGDDTIKIKGKGAELGENFVKGDVKSYKIEEKGSAETPIKAADKSAETPAKKVDLSQNEEDWLNGVGWTSSSGRESIKRNIDKIKKNDFKRDVFETKGMSVQDFKEQISYEGSDVSLKRILEHEGYEVFNAKQAGLPSGYDDWRFKERAVSPETTTSANAPSSNTSAYDTTFDTYGKSTHTTSPDASSEETKQTLNQYLRNANKKRGSTEGIVGIKQKVTRELPKGEKVNVKGSRNFKLNGNSSYKDVVQRYKGSSEREALEEIEQGYKKFKGKDTTKTLDTYLKSPQISNETKKILIQQRENNEAFVKEVLTDKAVTEQAELNLGNDFEGTVAALKRKLNNGEQFTKQDEADLFLAVRKYDAEGAVTKAAELLAMSDAPVGDAAKVLQFRRWLYKTTPEGRVYSALNTLKKIAKNNGTNLDKIKVNEKLLDAIHDAKTEKELDNAIKEFQVNIWNQIPASFIEKANAWRYLAMLGNPKTHIRNALGNAFFVPFRVTSDIIATGVQRGLKTKRAKLGGVSGNHAILNRFNVDDRARLKLADESFKDRIDAMSSASSKFYEMQRPIESPTFTGKILDKLSRGNSNWLEREDKFFMGINYRSAYAQYLKSHNIKASDVTEEIAKKASEYAENAALKATYRDANKLAETLNKFRKNLKPTAKDNGLVALGKNATGLLMDSTVPFVKTPLNILKRGAVEYSPYGLLKGFNDIVRAKDAKQLLDGIEYFSNGFTGTGVLIAGYFLGKSGLVNGSMGKYDKTVAYDKTLGKQDYAINVLDHSITLDWVAPMSMPFFVGVEAGSNEAADGDVWAGINALTKMTDPIFEMSMLQGVENTFNTAMNEEGGLGTIAKNTAFNYASQYVPTLFGQITRAFVNDNRKTAVSTASDPFKKEVEKQIGKIINKTPLSNGLSQDYVDQWGRTEPNDNKVASFLENFISPAYVSAKNVTPVDEEIKRLYEELGAEDQKKIIPNVDSGAYKQKFDGEEYVMTPSQFTQYKKTVGQAKYKGLEKLFNTQKYKDASEDEKRKMIEAVYDEANAKGKKEFLTEASEEYASAPDFYELDKTQRDKYNDSIDMEKEDWAKIYRMVLDKSNEKKEATGKGSSADEKRFQLLENGVETYEQAQSFLGETTSKDKWDEAQEAYKDGKTLKDVEKEAKLKAEEEERQKNMTEEEKKFENYFKKNVSEKYDKKVVSQKLVDEYIARAKYADGQNDKNGSIRQSEAKAALDSMTNLTREQKAYLWSISNTWKRNPYN